MLEEAFDRNIIDPSAVGAIAPRFASRANYLIRQYVDQESTTALTASAMHLLHRLPERVILAAPPPIEPFLDFFGRQRRIIEPREELKQTRELGAVPSRSYVANRFPLEVVRRGMGASAEVAFLLATMSVVRL